MSHKDPIATKPGRMLGGPTDGTSVLPSIGSRLLLEERDPQRNHNYLLLFGRTVAFFNGVGLAHVLALLGFAVIARTFLMIDVAVGIDPYHSMATACRWCSINLG